MDLVDDEQAEAIPHTVEATVRALERHHGHALDRSLTVADDADALAERRA